MWSQALRRLATACPSTDILDLEHPISSHTSQDLESIVIRAVKLDHAWASPNPTPVRTRRFHRPETLRLVEYIPGGRWLIVASPMSRDGVQYYDLEAEETLEPRVLIPPGDAVGYGYSIHLALDIKKGRTLLTLDLVLLVENPGMLNRLSCIPKSDPGP